MQRFFCLLLIFSQVSLLAGDSADNLALTMLLKKKKFTPQYAQSRLNFGKEIKEPYITQSRSKELNKSFLKPVFRSSFNKWKKYYLKGGGFRAKQLLAKGAPYKKIVENIFIYHRLPKELYYVGLTESRYELRIKSPAGARGPWQFLASTGREYGLIVNRYYDERTNLVKSTHAAAKYFKDLYNIFGSWELALSAYNAGEYGVIRRIRKAGTRDFYKLSHRKVLPKETRNYIPKILALSEIDKKSHKYGIKVKKPSHPLGKYENTYLVALKKSHKLKKIASKVGVHISKIKKLNPELRGHYTPQVKSGSAYKLRLPRARNERFMASKPLVKVKKSQRKVPTFHKVQSGENLSKIAKKHHIPLGQIMLANHGLEKRTLHPGDTIRLKPFVAKKRSPASTRKVVTKAKAKTRKTMSYKVKKGDSLFSISMLFNVRIADIKKANKLKKNNLSVGKKLKIPGVQRRVHIVKKGEFLKKIAKKYDTSSKALEKLNGLKKSVIYPGMRLVVVN